MAEDTKIIKTYGKLPKTNGTVEITGAIVTDLKVAPEYEVETVDVGGVPEGGKRTLKSVKTTGTLYVLDTGSVAATETPLETLAETLATENDLAPAGGSTIVEFGDEDLTPNKLRTLSFTASYYPNMKKTI